MHPSFTNYHIKDKSAAEKKQKKKLVTKRQSEKPYINY
jgi:hypothetical protein